VSGAGDRSFPASIAAPPEEPYSRLDRIAGVTSVALTRDPRRIRFLWWASAELVLALAAAATGSWAGLHSPGVHAAEAPIRRPPAMALVDGFVPNRGQGPAEVDFVSGWSGPRVALASKGPWMVIDGPDDRSAAVRQRFLGSRANARPRPSGSMEATVTYLLGRQPSSRLSGLPAFATVTYAGIYPGIDARYRLSGGSLEYDLIVWAGADPSAIQMRFDGATRVWLDAGGWLVIDTAAGRIRQRAPVAYQPTAQGRSSVSSRFSVDSRGVVEFAVGAFDRRLSLVIDPVILYQVTVGTGDGGSEVALSVDTDGRENAWLTGSTSAPNFPTTPGAFDRSLGGPLDAFVTRLDPNGNVVWSTYLGGSGTDQGRGIAVDPTGNVTVTGRTDSTDFPLKAAFQPAPGGGVDAFVTRLNPSGTGLVWSTYLGGSGDEDDHGADMAASGRVGEVDVDNTTLAAVVTGSTDSTDFPTVRAIQGSNAGGDDAFLTVLRSNGRPSFSTYRGGSSDDLGNGLELASTGGVVYAFGQTASSDFPTSPNAFQRIFGGATDAFVWKMNPRQPASGFSTFLGGSGREVAGSQITHDVDGDAYVSGETNSTNFPTTPGAFQEDLAGGYDMFAAKVVPNGSSLVYGTYIGGTQDETGTAVGIDFIGKAGVAGSTVSADFPEKLPFEPCTGAPEMVLVELTVAGDGLEFSSCFSASPEARAERIKVGRVFLTGQTGSGDILILKVA
jgi:Beta-propeller repeat